MTKGLPGPFFKYYGAKYRAVKKGLYPAPRHPAIIEPFAGAAGYSTRFFDRTIRLADANPKIVALWRYLISVSAEEIRGLPAHISHVDEAVGVCEEGKWLIGFWFNPASTAPCNQRSTWSKIKRTEGILGDSLEVPEWSPKVRDRIAHQVERIRHWRIAEKSYDELTFGGEATWYIDPPYQAKCGRRYGADVTDFYKLGEWCKSRRGQVIVCENNEADWLPFRPLASIQVNASKRGKGVSKEVIWTNDEPETPEGFGL